MPGERAVCHAGHALRSHVVLSRLFDIPLARLRSVASSHCSAAAFSTTVRHRSDNGESPTFRYVGKTSLDVTLEAHRQANRDSLIHKVSPTGEEKLTVWFRPDLPPDRFDPVARDGETRTKKKEGRNGSDQKGPWQWSNQAAASRTMPIYHIGAKERSLPPVDYVGEYLEPLHSRDDVRDEDLPWFAASLRSDATPMERLRAEIEAFAEHIQPTPEEHTGRIAVVDKMLDTWARFIDSRKDKNYKGLKLELFGSQRNGLATATSDLDVRLYDPKISEKSDEKQAPKHMTRKLLKKGLEMTFPFYQADDQFMLVFLRFSRYPLISMQHAPSSLDVQIVASNDTSYARMIMDKYMEELPALRSLYMLIRYLLEIRGLHDVFRGGISSYSVFYLIVAGIKLGSSPASHDPAEQLLAVLDFYSQFDTTNNWISLEPLSILPKIESKPVLSREEKAALRKGQRIGAQNKDQPYLLSIRDPADATNDLGRKTFGWKHLQATFKTLNEVLRQKLEKNDGSLLLKPLVGTSFELMEARREKIAAFGRQHRSVHTTQEVQVDAQEVQIDTQKGQIDAQKDQVDTEVQLDTQEVQVDKQEAQVDIQEVQVDTQEIKNEDVKA
ncbi:Non-canonical poly(A) RNA polymerase protein Trf4-1 [Lasiodiplodia theobromae]|uniref:polynucleotide adenylyltransferase n=1 Tax=Lasiodiplodia theobromae TaxID=45133 RepID=A0A5N5DQ23_9PEZI|nr:Non-canonical poly(A) RNA polymerase protein Trf4-1 [Lasiodiplodia theobromae]